MKSLRVVASLVIASCWACHGDGGTEDGRDASEHAEAGILEDASTAEGGAMDAGNGSDAGASDALVSPGDGGVRGDGGDACATGACVCEAGPGACGACPGGEARLPDGGCPVSKCVPACASDKVCSPLSAMCCECLVGETSCWVTGQRACMADSTSAATGCGVWSQPVACGNRGCLDKKVCKTGERQTRIEQWGVANGSEVHAIAVGRDGEALVAGRAYGSVAGQPALGKADSFVAAHHPSAQIAQNWARQWGTAEDDFAAGVAVDGDGNVVVAGQRWASAKGAPDAHLTKWRPDHTLAWEVSWGSTALERVTDLAIDATGDLFVCGWTAGDLVKPNAGRFDIFLSKVSAAGTVLWSVQFGDSDDDLGVQVTTDQAGNAYLVGLIRGKAPASGAQGSSDIFVAKLSSAGQVLWSRKWGAPEDDGGLDIAALNDGNLLVAGFTLGQLEAGVTNGAFLARLDAGGNTIWVKQFGATPSDGADRIAVSGDVVYIAGTTFGSFVTNGASGGQDLYVQARDLNGGVLWSEQFGSKLDDQVQAIAARADGLVYVGGLTFGALPGVAFEGPFDGFLMSIPK
jgi:hypothetical protein